MKKFVDMELPGGRPCLSSFVGSGSWLLFDMAGVKERPEWLQSPAMQWELFEGYAIVKKFVDKLPVTNDSAERGMALIKQFIINAKDETKKQDLIQLVQDHRQEVPDLKKATLQEKL